MGNRHLRSEYFRADSLLAGEDHGARILTAADGETFTPGNALTVDADGNVEDSGSAPGGGGGTGRVLISQGSASSSASLDFDSVFSSTYDRYEIELISILPDTDSNTVLDARFRSGGSYQTTNYQYHHESRRGSDSRLDTIANSSGATIRIAGVVTGVNVEIGTSSSGGVNGIIYIHNPSSTVVYKTLRTEATWFNSSSGEVMVGRGSGAWKDTAAVTGIQFLFNTGNIASGTIRVWGVPTS